MDIEAPVVQCDGRGADADLIAYTPRGVAESKVAKNTFPRDFGAGEGEPQLVRHAARPTAAELANVRVRALNLIHAVARSDWSAVHHLRPRTAVDGGYLVTAMAEVVVELARYLEEPLGAWLDYTRAATTRTHHAHGGRP